MAGPGQLGTDGGGPLYAISPAAAQFFQPVQRSCTDNGVTMEVAAVRIGGDTAEAYITLSGEAVDGACDLFDSYNFHLPFDRVGCCQRVGYDEESRTAAFLCTAKTMDGSPIPTGGKMTFSVERLRWRRRGNGSGQRGLRLHRRRHL